MRERTTYRPSSVCPIIGSVGTEFTPKVYGDPLRSCGMRAVAPESCGRVARSAMHWQSGIVATNMRPEAVFLTIPDLVERFDSTPGKLRRLIEDHYLLAVRIDGVLKVPAEFVQGNQPLPSLRGTVLALLDAGFSEEEAVDWLFSSSDELGGRPIDELVAGRKSAVRRATQSLAF